ncbi:MAG: PilZ domain-containing protein [Planctomycetota bacterium]|jgi:hypothetical protein
MEDEANRRREKRLEMTSVTAASLECGGRQIEAFLTDLSPNGAGFRIEKCPEGLELQTGDELSGAVKTVYGESNFSAKIAWAKRDGEKYDFGVEIVEME